MLSRNLGLATLSLVRLLFNLKWTSGRFSCDADDEMSAPLQAALCCARSLSPATANTRSLKRRDPVSRPHLPRRTALSPPLTAYPRGRAGAVPLPPVSRALIGRGGGHRAGRRPVIGGGGGRRADAPFKLRRVSCGRRAAAGAPRGRDVPAPARPPAPPPSRSCFCVAAAVPSAACSEPVLPPGTPASASLPGYPQVPAQLSSGSKLPSPARGEPGPSAGAP